MSAKKQKYYVVWAGHEPGIYKDWKECERQVRNFPNARYKSFSDLSEAESAYLDPTSQKSPSKQKSENKKLIERANIITPSISVDAACSGNPGLMEYRGVWTGDGAEIFRQGPYEMGTNNIGEFLALVHGLAYLQKNGMEEIPLYTDSRTGLSWVRKKAVKTTLVNNRKTAILHQLIQRALKWLHTHEYKTQIIKWETDSWGEIPADFGRK